MMPHLVLVRERGYRLTDDHGFVLCPVILVEVYNKGHLRFSVGMHALECVFTLTFRNPSLTIGLR